MGRRRRKENSTLQNTKNSIEDLVERKMLMEKLQETVKQNIQNELKEYLDNTNKELDKTQKQINECRGGIKHQCETKQRYMK
jgi:hypothetical protein